MRSFASSFFFELVQVLNGKVFVPQPDVVQFVSGIRFIISSHTSQGCFFKYSMNSSSLHIFSKLEPR